MQKDVTLVEREAFVAVAVSFALFSSSTISEERNYSNNPYRMSIPSHSSLSVTELGVPAAQNLEAFNTLGLACQAQRVVTLTQVAQLPQISDLAAVAGGAWVLGGGSNVILPAHLAALVVHVQLKGVSLAEARPDAWVVDVAGGENWQEWVSRAVDCGWDGLENLALIPGTVGAAPVQNIGAYGVEIASRIESVQAWNVPQAKMMTLDATACGFRYRDSLFKRAAPGTWIITSVRFVLPRPWTPVIDYPDLLKQLALEKVPVAQLTARHIFDAVCAVRLAKLPDPAVLGNAGSFFKNPIIGGAQHALLREQFDGLVSYPQPDGNFKLAAGWLIEQCGWKGRQVGPVGVHARQALVLVNYGGASAVQLLALASEVVQSVQRRFGVALEIEPVVVPAA